MVKQSTGYINPGYLQAGKLKNIGIDILQYKEILWIFQRILTSDKENTIKAII